MTGNSVSSDYHSRFFLEESALKSFKTPRDDVDFKTLTVYFLNNSD